MSTPPPGTDEAAALAQRYARRDAAADAARYSLFDPAALQAQQERLPTGTAAPATAASRGRWVLLTMMGLALLFVVAKHLMSGGMTHH